MSILQRKIRKTKVNGAALTYVVVISVIIALVLGLMLLLSFFHQKEFVILNRKTQLLDNCTSGLNILSVVEDPYYEKEVDLFEEGSDSVSLFKKPWGLYSVISARAHWKNFSASRSALIGRAPDSLMVLYLADQNRPLSLAGSTVIKGNVRTPKAGIKRAYIEGVNFSGKNLVQGVVRSSDFGLPEINTFNLKATLDELEMVGESLYEGDTLLNSFSSPTIILNKDDYSNTDFTGNIVLYSDTKIVLPSSCKAHDVIAIADQIIVEKGFKGNVQLIARDSIRISEESILSYPSALALIPNNKQNVGQSILLGKGSKVFGTVMMNLDGTGARNKPILTISREAELVGDAYVNGFTQLQGTVTGQLLTEKFYLKTAASIYENHILNGIIKQNEQISLPTGLVKQENMNDNRIAKWLSY